jgi:hypothetical protein
MNNKTRFIPLFLLLLYILTIGINKTISFEFKLFSIILIILFSQFIIYKNYKKGELSKKNIFVFILFLIITIGMSYLSLLKVL